MERLCCGERRKGPSGFGVRSTAEEVTDGIDASNITAIVTGATSGIGMETARVLALRGAMVIIAAIGKEIGEEAKEKIVEEIPHANIEVMEVDLSSLASVRSFAAAFLSSNKPLNLLVNNAGIFACPFQLSVDGIELQFATNHIGHFLLTNLLLNKMKATARESGIDGRIVTVASAGHSRTYQSGIRFKNINNPSGYGRLKAYGQSKLANILHVKELSRRLQEEGAKVTANCLHPGAILTNIAQYYIKSVASLAFLVAILSPFLKTAQQGAATTCYLALHPNLKGISGKYFSDCKEDWPTSQGRDSDLAKKLWEFSEEIISTKLP